MSVVVKRATGAPTFPRGKRGHRETKAKSTKADKWKGGGRNQRQKEREGERNGWRERMGKAAGALAGIYSNVSYTWQAIGVGADRAGSDAMPDVAGR